MKVYCYYESLPGPRFAEDALLVREWLENWVKHGWRACILGPLDAQQHEAFAATRSFVTSFEGDTPLVYRVATWSRWLAFAHAMRRTEAGLIVDYDVFNRGFTPDMAKPLLCDRLVNLSLGYCAMPIVCTSHQAQTIPALMHLHAHVMRQAGTLGGLELHDDPWMNYLRDTKSDLVRLIYLCVLHGEEADQPLVHIASQASLRETASKLHLWRQMKAKYA